jgi:hypothetical protein
MPSIPSESRAKPGPNRLRKQPRLFSIDEKDEEKIDDPTPEPTQAKPVIGHPFQREILLDPFGLPLYPQPVPDERDPLTWSHGRKMNILAHISVMSFLAQFLANSIVSNRALFHQIRSCRRRCSHYRPRFLRRYSRETRLTIQVTRPLAPPP